MIQLRRIMRIRKNWMLWNNTQRKLILQAIVMFHITPIAMYVLGVQKWLRIVGFWTPINNQPRHVTAAQLDQVHWLNIQAVNHSLIRGKCLSRSINLWWLMRRHHIDSELRIGVHNNNEKFKAHAWLEYQGRPINSDHSIVQRFHTIDQLTLSGDCKNS